jgi:hypothetical protein
MINWTEFERQQPALAAAGRQQLYTFGIGLGFLATVRPDGGPRVTDPSVRAVVRDQISRERDGNLWPTFNDDALFELTIDRCLLTRLDHPFPQGPTIWSVRHEAPPRGIRATRTPGAMGG